MTLTKTIYESQLWYPPAVPSAWDDEFDGAVLDPKWTQTGTFDFTVPPQIGASFTAGNIRCSLTRRKSWLRVQPPASGSMSHALYQYPIGSGSEIPDGRYMVRLGGTHRYATVGTFPEATYRLELLASTGTQGNFSIYWQDPAQGGGITAIVQEASVDRQIRHYGGDKGFEMRWSYLCFIKKSGVYTGWCRGENGTWGHLFTHTYPSYGGGTVDRVRMGFGNRLTTDPGNMEMEIDFFRYSAETELP